MTEETPLAGDVGLGISIWRDAGWRDVVFPLGLQQRRELESLRAFVSTIEIHGTFYWQQRPEFLHRWGEPALATWKAQDVLLYLDCDAKARVLFDAQALKSRGYELNAAG
jgi:hypothetical protein